jgi:GDP-L-fucose synthase
MPKALIIGSDGFLGRNLVRRLNELGGWSVQAVGRAAGDLSRPGVADSALAAATPVDFIFHVVTRQRTGQIQFGIQGEMLAINAAIHLNVLEAWRTRQPQAKFVSTGSSCAYPESDQPLTEEMFGTGRAHPSVTGYALAKHLLATGAQTYAEQYGLKHLHCILATLYGPGDHKAPDRSHFVGAMLDRAAAEKTTGAGAFSVWGDPATVREVLYVDDQIDAILAANTAFENRLINCAPGSPVTVAEVAEAILDALAWKGELVTASDSFKGAAFKLLDSSRFLETTGWRPAWPLARGLRRLIDLEYSTAL